MSRNGVLLTPKLVFPHAEMIILGGWLELQSNACSGSHVAGTNQYQLSLKTRVGKRHEQPNKVAKSLHARSPRMFQQPPWKPPAPAPAFQQVCGRKGPMAWQQLQIATGDNHRNDQPRYMMGSYMHIERERERRTQNSEPIGIRLDWRYCLVSIHMLSPIQCG